MTTGDIKCTFGNELATTSEPACLRAIVKGEQGGMQGHKDAQAFATYAMGT